MKRESDNIVEIKELNNIKIEESENESNWRFTLTIYYTILLAEYSLLIVCIVLNNISAPKNIRAN